MPVNCFENEAQLPSEQKFFWRIENFGNEIINFKTFFWVCCWITQFFVYFWSCILILFFDFSNNRMCHRINFKCDKKLIHKKYLIHLLSVSLKDGHRVLCFTEIPKAEGAVLGRSDNKWLRRVGMNVGKLLIMSCWQICKRVRIYFKQLYSKIGFSALKKMYLVVNVVTLQC